MGLESTLDQDKLIAGVEYFLMGRELPDRFYMTDERHSHYISHAKKEIADALNTYKNSSQETLDQEGNSILRQYLTAAKKIARINKEAKDGKLRSLLQDSIRNILVQYSRLYHEYGFAKRSTQPEQVSIAHLQFLQQELTSNKFILPNCVKTLMQDEFLLYLRSQNLTSAQQLYIAGEEIQNIEKRVNAEG